MPPRKKTPAAAPPAETDPLADLRQEWTGGDPEEDALDDVLGPDVEPADQEDQDTVSVPLTTEEQREEMTAVIIAAWHADPVSHGFLHRGNRCGCRYIIARALDAVAPVAPDEDEEEADPDGE